MGISRIGNITGYGQIASGKRINKAADDAAANGLEARERANQIAYENMTAAQSRIEDLEMGKAVTELRKEETLQDVKIAMLNNKKEQDKIVLRLF